MNIGRRTKDWNNARRKLKVMFESLGITRCEKCHSDFALGFAHRLKRRFITDREELMTVALLCNDCHSEIEYSGHENMYRDITAIIESRC
jgi:hypothetical protein